MKKNVFIKIFIIVALLSAGAAFGYLAYKEHKPFSEAKSRHNALVTVVAEELPKDKDPMDRFIDFEALQKINPEIIGWIYAPQVDVDEPILKGTDNSFYLTHDFEKTYSPLGSVFTWSDANEELEDDHVLLFGHNMMSGQIFGKLSKFKDEAFLDADPVVYVYTPYHVKKLEAVESYVCDINDDIFKDDWKSDERQVFTLVTCDGYDNTPMRLVVNCRWVEERLVGSQGYGL